MTPCAGGKLCRLQISFVVTNIGGDENYYYFYCTVQSTQWNKVIETRGEGVVSRNTASSPVLKDTLNLNIIILVVPLVQAEHVKLTPGTLT